MSHSICFSVTNAFPFIIQVPVHKLWGRQCLPLPVTKSAYKYRYCMQNHVHVTEGTVHIAQNALQLHAT